MAIIKNSLKCSIVVTESMEFDPIGSNSTLYNRTAKKVPKIK